MTQAHQDLSGTRFGRWLVLSLSPDRKGGKRTWLCVCECGTERSVVERSLKSGVSTSCGCYHNELVGQQFRKHGLYGRSEYAIWTSMIDRCENPKSTRFSDYGGRGITICTRWRDSFESFLSDMGERPPGTSVERRDVNKGYSPENCYWATDLEQANNTRRNRFIEHQGKRQTLAQWCRELGLPYGTVASRINQSGWNPVKALTAPIQGARA